MFDQLLQLFQNPGQTINSIIANPSAWFPLLFFVGYQAFFEPVGWTTWSMLLTSPIWLIIGVPLNAMAPWPSRRLHPRQPEGPESPPAPDSLLRCPQGLAGTRAHRW